MIEINQTTDEEILSTRCLASLKKLKKNCRYWDATTKQFGFFIASEGELAQLKNDDEFFTVCPTKLYKANCWEGLRVRHAKHGTGVIDRWRGGNWWVEWENGCGLDVPDEKLIPLIEVGDRFAVARGITQECTVIEIIKGKKPYRIKWELKGEEWEVDIEFFRKLRRLDIEDLNSWNPDNFGSLPYKADGDQLTIFCDDTNEPPEPDDYPSIPDYEKAWTEWQLKNITTKERKTMTAFQFSGTQQIANQIAQLQKQLDQLTTSLKPYQECEQKAEDLRSQVAEYGQEMKNKGIPQEDKLDWAKSLYSAASGLEFVEGDLGAIAAQNEAIAQLKAELTTAQKLRYQASSERQEAMALLETTTAQRNEALDKIVNMTEQGLHIVEKLKTLQERHAQVLQEIESLKEQTDAATIEVLREENASLIVKIQELEALADDMDAQPLEHQLIPEVEALKQEIEGLKSSNKELRSQREQLEKKLVIYAEDTKELDSYVAQVKQLEKENHTYQEMYEGQKAQKEQWENDFYKIRNERNQLEKQLKELNTTPLFAPISAQSLLDESTISEQIIDILKGQDSFSGNQIIKSLGMDDESGRGVYTELNRLVAKGAIFCNRDPLDKRRNLYTVHPENNTQHDTQHLENNTQHDTLKDPANVCDRVADITAQSKGRDFVASIKTKAGMNNLAWPNISDVCQSNPAILREIIHSSQTKLQLDFTNIDNLAKLMSEYILETGDITDFDWLDKTFVDKVEALVEAKKSLPLHQGDWVRVKETGAIWQIRTFDGEWINAIADGRITSLHKSEVELLKVEVAA